VFAVKEPVAKEDTLDGLIADHVFPKSEEDCQFINGEGGLNTSVPTSPKQTEGLVDATPADVAVFIVI